MLDNWRNGLKMESSAIFSSLDAIWFILCRIWNLKCEIYVYQLTLSIEAFKIEQKFIQKSWNFTFFKIAHITIPDYAEHICFILFLWSNKFKQSVK